MRRRKYASLASYSTTPGAPLRIQREAVAKVSLLNSFPVVTHLFRSNEEKSEKTSKLLTRVICITSGERLNHLQIYMLL